MERQRNCSIDIVRCIASVLVLALHVGFLSGVNSKGYFIFSILLPRLAVPFFTIVSGYYFFKRIDNKDFSVGSYVYKLIKTLFGWCIVYQILDIILEKKFDYQLIPMGLVMDGRALHLWYVPAVIIAVIISYSLYMSKLRKLLIPFSIFCFVFGILLNFNVEKYTDHFMMFNLEEIEYARIVSFVSIAIPFFVCGYVLNLTKKHWENRSNFKIFIFLILCVAFYLAEVKIGRNHKIINLLLVLLSMYPLLYCGMVFLIKNPMPKLYKISDYCKELSVFTYFSHYGILNIFYKVLPSSTATEKFIYTLIITFCLGSITYFIKLAIKNKKIKGIH